MAGWITIHGTHVYVRDGQTPEEAFKELTGQELKTPSNETNKQVNGKLREAARKYNISRTAEVIAKEQYRNVLKNDKIITPELTKIVDSCGVELVGVDFRVKNPDSFTRKFNGEIKEINNDIAYSGYSKQEREEIALTNIHDANRYTAQLTNENFLIKYQEIDKKLKAAGWKQRKCKNTYKLTDVPYRGVNCQYEKNGIVFELQFHTKESLVVKDTTHKDYEEWREEIPKGLKQSEVNKIKQHKEELLKKMINITNTLTKPSGIDNI